MEYSQYKEELLDAMKETFPEMTYSIESKFGINGYTDNLLGTVEGETYGLCQNVRHAYEAGASVESIVKGVMDNVLLHPMGNLDEFLKFENAKEHIVFRLLNWERNESLLRSVPHRRWNDLAVVYHIAPWDAVMRFVTHDMADLWGITEEGLWELAKENTPRKFPIFHESLVDFVTSQSECPEFGYLLGQVLDERYLVISNSAKMFGASAVLYADAEELFNSVYGDDGCFIIPINIHESVVAPADTGFSMEDLKNTVDDLCVRYIVGDEYLTKTIYRFTPENGVTIV